MQVQRIVRHRRWIYFFLLACLLVGRARSGKAAQSSSESLLAIRRRLIEYIWKSDGFPTAKLPDIVKTNVRDSRFDSLPNLKRIDELQILLPYRSTSLMYHFRPITSNRMLIIYHGGHGDNFNQEAHSIAFFLSNGFDVIAAVMVPFEQNRMPRVTGVSIGSHDDFVKLESATFSSLRFFIEPVVIALNYALSHQSYDSVAMVGLSGGGWTTTVAAAVDDRITRSYPVAGSIPAALRHDDEIGDYEQWMPGLYQIAYYETLYQLGGMGNGRAQRQVLNSNDPCCFAASGRVDQIRAYETSVDASLASIGSGEFSVLINDGSEHIVADTVLTYIKEDLTSPVRGLSVRLEATPAYGQAPLETISLTATIMTDLSGPFSYTFYCNRSDNGTNITAGWTERFQDEAGKMKTPVGLCSYDLPGKYTAKVIIESGTAPPAEYRIPVVVTPPVGGEPSLTVTLAADQPADGTPVATLRVTGGGTATGPVNYVVYCDREDSGTDTVGWDIRVQESQANSLTLPDACRYRTAGVHTAKVIVERGVATAAEARVQIVVPRPPMGFPRSDFNGDGTDDLLVQYQGPPQGYPGAVVWFLKVGSDCAGPEVCVDDSLWLFKGNTNWRIVGVGDFNDDGYPDVVWQNPTGLVQIWLMRSVVQIGYVSLVREPTEWKIVGVGDFDGDGSIDLVWQYPQGQVFIWFMNRTVLRDAQWVYRSGTSWRVVGVGDYNGDSHPDLIWQSDGGAVIEWFMEGAEQTGGVFVSQDSTSWKVVATFDVNLDGASDLVWQSSSGFILVWRLTGTTQTDSDYLLFEGTPWMVVGPH